MHLTKRQEVVRMLKLTDHEKAMLDLQMGKFRQKAMEFN